MFLINIFKTLFTSGLETEQEGVSAVSLTGYKTVDLATL